MSHVSIKMVIFYQTLILSQ